MRNATMNRPKPARPIRANLPLAEQLRESDLYADGTCVRVGPPLRLNENQRAAIERIGNTLREVDASNEPAKHVYHAKAMLFDAARQVASGKLDAGKTAKHFADAKRMGKAALAWGKGYAIGRDEAAASRPAAKAIAKPAIRPATATPIAPPAAMPVTVEAEWDAMTQAEQSRWASRDAFIAVRKIEQRQGRRFGR